MVLLTTLVPLILLIWSVRGITAAREGLIVLPIPIATSAIILHLISFLKNYAPGNELASFASSLTPLVWVPIFMMIGFSLPEDIESDNDQKNSTQNSCGWLETDYLSLSPFCFGPMVHYNCMKTYLSLISGHPICSLPF